MNERETMELMEDVAAVMRSYVSTQISPVMARLDALTKVRGAEYDVRLAEFDARMVAVADLERKVAERLASLKDGADGKDGKDGVDGGNGADGTDGQNGEAGKDADPEVTERLVAEAVERAVAAIEKPKDGHSPTDEELAPVIAEHVQRAVSAIPAPENGRDGADGKDADSELMRAMVTEAAAALPAPEPGKDADPELVASLVAETVERAVAALPAPKNGEPGKDAEPVIIRFADEYAPDLIADNVAIAVRMLAEAPQLVTEQQQSALTLNINQAATPRQISKTIKTRRDESGNLIAEVQEIS